MSNLFLFIFSFTPPRAGVGWNLFWS